MNPLNLESGDMRSFISHKLQQQPALEAADNVVATPSQQPWSEQAVQSGLIDLSVHPRCGFRGARAADHLQAAGLTLPDQPNRATCSQSGELVLRLSPNEYWVLDNLLDPGAKFGTLNKLACPEDQCYPLFCQNSHTWLAMTGNALAQTMAKVCGVDLRPQAFPVGAVVQTSVALVLAIIVHHEINQLPVFSILSDSASTEYLWESLLDAMQEFDGKALRLNTSSR